MGMMNFEIPHALPSSEDARKRMERLMQYWGTKYGVTSQWSGDEATLNGKVKGISLQAKLRVTKDRVHGEATDPGLLLRNPAKKYLTHKLQTFLDPKRNLEDLLRDDD